MSRYTGPKCRLCRREGVKLFLKGARCQSPMCAITRRQTAPGQHGLNRRARVTTYGKQLREKQKVKRMYGLLESQFQSYFKAASISNEETGAELLKNLEIRLDNIVYRLGLAHSRAHARQLVSQCKFSINGKTVDRASYQLKVGDKIEVKDKGLAKVNASNVSWLDFDDNTLVAQVKSMPTRADIAEPIEDHLIIEFYSR